MKHSCRFFSSSATSVPVIGEDRSGKAGGKAYGSGIGAGIAKPASGIDGTVKPTRATFAPVTWAGETGLEVLLLTSCASWFTGSTSTY